MAQGKAKLHRLVDELPESEFAAARRFLEYLRDAGDPLVRALLDAPPDDEPETPEEAAAVAEGRTQLGAGRLISHEKVRRRWLGR